MHRSIHIVARVVKDDLPFLSCEVVCRLGRTRRILNVHPRIECLQGVQHMISVPISTDIIVIIADVIIVNGFVLFR